QRSRRDACTTIIPIIPIIPALLILPLWCSRPGCACTTILLVSRRILPHEGQLQSPEGVIPFPLIHTLALHFTSPRWGFDLSYWLRFRGLTPPALRLCPFGTKHL